MLKLTLLSFAAWASTIVLYLLGIFITAAIFGNAKTSTAEVAFLALITGEVIVACVAIAFVFFRSQGVFHMAVRLLWVVVFAILQIATLALTVLMSMLVFNR